MYEIHPIWRSVMVAARKSRLNEKGIGAALAASVIWISGCGVFSNMSDIKNDSDQIKTTSQGIASDSDQIKETSNQIRDTSVKISGDSDHLVSDSDQIKDTSTQIARDSDHIVKGTDHLI